MSPDRSPSRPAASSLRADAAAIWSAAIRAVQPERLAAERLSLVGSADELLWRRSTSGDAALVPLSPAVRLADVERIVVVGGGKAAAGLAAGIERLLGPARLERHRVTGLVSVPAGCGRSLSRIEVRETRPAAANLPTPAVVQATLEMLALVGSLGPRDLAIAVITGGGSALLAAPREGVTLAEKIALTRQLSESGADIATLNAARRRLSIVKGGGLATACTAGRLLVLAISDVIGDDLDVIASGPCMPPAGHAGDDSSTSDGNWTTPAGCHVSHMLLATNGTAVAAAVAEAERLGYAPQIGPATVAKTPADDTAEAVGQRLAREAEEVAAAVGRDGRSRAVIAGGEATVTVPADHGVGGRNQQTVLAAIDAIAAGEHGWPAGLLVASVGTDGEDGPTDAAGGVADADVVAAIDRLGLDVPRSLARCDAHPLLAAAGGLVTTGPTGTNVADVRIVLARP
jgi:hydroxypyruvate reductase